MKPQDEKKAAASFQRIDPIISTNEMIEELKNLDKIERQEVIFIGLRTSRHQFHWSYFAKMFKIPRYKWPDKI